MIPVAKYMLEQRLCREVCFSPGLPAKSSWNMKRPSLVAVSREVSANAEIAREITVNVASAAAGPKPIFTKNPLMAVANTTAGVPIFA